jgi:LPXTG-site transpeptidase (sortase) family protein
MILQPLLLESDIRSFLQPAPREASKARSFIGIILLALISGVVTFLALNLPAYFDLHQSTGIMHSSTAIAASVEPTATPALATAITAPTPTPEPTPSIDIPDNTVSFPDLGISIPVSWNVSFDAKSESNALANGAIHIAGTGDLNTIGMHYITAHSSDYPAPISKGHYKTAFAPLENAKTGQKVYVNENGTTYTYEIQKISVVAPTDLSVLTDTSDTGVNFVTCTPIGTSTNRLVVRAIQLNSSQNIPFTPTTFSQNLPAAR